MIYWSNAVSFYSWIVCRYRQVARMQRVGLLHCDVSCELADFELRRLLFIIIIYLFIYFKCLFLLSYCINIL